MKFGTFRFVILLASVFIAVSVANAQSCQNSITSCGCTITLPGTYTVDASLSSTYGQFTPLNGCIDVAAPNVRLLTQGYAIQGTAVEMGGLPGTIGIHLLPTADHVLVEGFGDWGGTYPNGGGVQSLIGSFEYGLVSEANYAVVNNFNIQANSIADVMLNGAKNNILSNIVVATTLYGVWVKSGSQNVVSNISAQHPLTSTGVYIGCSAAGPDPSTVGCKPGKEPSGTVVYGYGYQYFGLGTSPYAIAVEKGSQGNTIVANIPSLDGFYDGNEDCGSNVWRVNFFATANQACIH